MGLLYGLSGLSGGDGLPFGTSLYGASLYRPYGLYGLGSFLDWAGPLALAESD